MYKILSPKKAEVGKVLNLTMRFFEGMMGSLYIIKKYFAINY